MRAGVHRVLLAATVGVFSLLATQFASAGVLIWFDCTDCPLLIPPSGAFGTTESVLDIDDSRTIEELDVFIDLDHTFPEDLDIFLEAPGGTIVQLFNEFDGDVDITDVTFDDEALTSISSVGPPSDPVRFDPGFLSDFDGAQSQRGVDVANRRQRRRRGRRYAPLMEHPRRSRSSA